MKSYYEIMLMHLLTIIIFSHSVEIKRNFFIEIPDDREIT